MAKVIQDFIRHSLIVQWSILGVLLVLLYYSALEKLVSVWWNDPNYSHGFLIPFLSAYLVWERRKKLQAFILRPNNWGVVVLIAGILGFVMGSVGAGVFVLRSSIIVVLAGLILFLMGTEALRTLLFPLTFLTLMIPLPDIIFTEITFPLQLFAAKTATFFLQAMNIPVLREGNIIFLAHMTLEVVEACSGIRSLVSLFALGIVFAYFTHGTTWKRIMLVFSAIPIAIIANGFRIFGTGLLAHFYGVGAAESLYHTFSGLLLFAVAFSLLLAEGVLLSRLFGGGK